MPQERTTNTRKQRIKKQTHINSNAFGHTTKITLLVHLLTLYKLSCSILW